MVYEKRLTEYQWSEIYAFLRKQERAVYAHKAESTRRFIEGVFWMLKSGAQWRLLPREYGNWNTTYRRFSDWANKGIWYKMLYYFSRDPDMEYIMVDSTILRAHACAAGAKGGRKNRH